MRTASSSTTITLRVPLVLSLPAGSRRAGGRGGAARRHRSGHAGRHRADGRQAARRRDAKDVDGIDPSPAPRARGCRRASCTRNRSRRSSNSDGRRCARSDRIGGSSSLRRSPSSSTSTAIRPKRTNLAAAQPADAQRPRRPRVAYSAARMPDTRTIDASGLDRLRALGYSMGPRHERDGGGRIDPKDRRDVAGAYRAGHVG